VFVCIIYINPLFNFSIDVPSIKDKNISYGNIIYEQRDVFDYPTSSLRVFGSSTNCILQCDKILLIIIRTSATQTLLERSLNVTQVCRKWDTVWFNRFPLMSYVDRFSSSVSNDVTRYCTLMERRKLALGSLTLGWWGVPKNGSPWGLTVTQSHRTWRSSIEHVSLPSSVIWTGAVWVYWMEN